MSAPVYSKQGIIAWLKTQDPATTYEYTIPWRCLVTMYLKAMGVETRVGFNELHAWGLHDTANSGGHDDTYGGALARAEAELAREPGS